MLVLLLHWLKTYFLLEVHFEILSGQKIGLFGPNGCGKTTFLKILTGAEKPDSGTLNISRGVQVGYFDQGHLSLNLKNTLIKNNFLIKLLTESNTISNIFSRFKNCIKMKP